eukprot:TRINITY_DN8146_c0_g1_i1.p1 TRINITY_DN8146_c0_g1~~TRINITY_DN8146_c0_g1_i1.p1  ORF type:complete len:293 (-),score=49.80 TRINITY_DN8146_c0_g1_i1:33-878(-)
MDQLGAFLVSLHPPEGRDPRHWHVPPEQHAVEIVSHNVIALSILLFTLSRPRKGVKITRDIQRGPFDMFFALVLIACLVIQTYYNYLMNPKWVVNLLHPCHIMSLMDVYLLIGKSPKLLHWIYNVSAFYTFFTVLALVFPDTSMLYLPYHIHVFWIQHIVVLLVPIYMLGTRKLTLDLFDNYFFIVAACVADLFFVNVQGFAGYLTSVNVNYLLWPPPSSPFTGQNYRTQSALAITVAMWLTGFVFVRLVRECVRPILFHFPPASFKMETFDSSSSSKKRK